MTVLEFDGFNQQEGGSRFILLVKQPYHHPIFFDIIVDI